MFIFTSGVEIVFLERENIFVVFSIYFQIKFVSLPKFLNYGI